jgi:hypothetical protein
MGVNIAPTRLTARTATTVSGSIGRRMPTRSPAATPSARSRAAARRTATASCVVVSSRTSPSSPSHVIATPSGSRAARGSVAAHDQSNDPPVHQRAHAGPPLASRTERGRRPQASPMSSVAAPQNQAGSATARACSASSDGSPVDRRNAVNRAWARIAFEGRQAASAASRPNSGWSSTRRVTTRRGRPSDGQARSPGGSVRARSTGASRDPPGPGAAGRPGRPRP